MDGEKHESGAAERFATDYLRRTSATVAGLDPAPIGAAIEKLRAAAAAGRTIFVCGNGGSSAIASQLVVDLLKGATTASGTPFRALCLSDNVPTLTAWANDADYDLVFVEPLRALARPGDVLIAISGSGESENVVRAVDYARGAGIETIGLTNGAGGRLKDRVDLPLLAASDHIGRLEDAFFVMTHIMAFACMERA